MGPNPLCENDTLAGIGVVKLQKAEDFFDFLTCPRNPLARIGGKCAKAGGFSRFLLCARL